jgi:cysteine desulfurase/selenocysteine lyase
MRFNVASIRKQFPILRRKINGHVLAYLDNASTTQKPERVIRALKQYYERYNANIHRGIHTLSEEATEKYEAARKTVAAFINAEPEEIIFTRNTTESINLVAYTWGRANIKKGDIILATEMEHHSNLLPWQALAKEKGAELRMMKITKDGVLIPHLTSPLKGEGSPLSLSLLRRGQGEVFAGYVKLLAITHMSNVLGTINPIKEIIKQAHKAGAKILIDAAQSAAHTSLDVKALDADFVAFSSHKMYGPTGVGVLYGKRELLEAMPPFLYGGDMVKAIEAKSDRYDTCHVRRLMAGARIMTGIIPVIPVWNDLPWKFEAGTSNIADVIAFGEAIKFIQEIGLENIQKHEAELTEYALEKLNALRGITIYGSQAITPPRLQAPGAPATGGQAAPSYNKRGQGGVNFSLHGPILAFNVKGIHAHDLATILNDYSIAIRSGHHCAIPLHQALGVPATARVSFGMYNTKGEIDRLVEGIKVAQKLLAY